MNWFDRWFVKKCKWAWDERYQAEECLTKPVEAVRDCHNLNDGLSIHLKQVIGGRLVTFSSYDRRTDRSDSRTYVITEDLNFEQELGKIITLEAMRQC